MSSSTTRRRISIQPGIESMSIAPAALLERFVFVAITGISFLNLSSFIPEKDSVGLDKFVLIKLCLTTVCGLVGFGGLLTIPRVQSLVLSLPGAWLFGVAALFAISAIQSPTPVISMASAAALWCILLFVVTAICLIGPERVLVATVLGITMFLLASFAAYFAMPSLGVFAEPLSDGEFSLRMSGISHPNTVGQFSAFAIGLAITMSHLGYVRSKLIYFLVPLGLAGLVFSISRSSTIAVIAALTFVYRDQFWKQVTIARLLLAGMLLSAVLLVATMQSGSDSTFFDSVVSKLTKSGDAEELTSMTGRTEIWAYSVQAIAERPLLGFGPATSKEILRDYAGYTHNLWLDVAFCSGLAGLFCFLGLTMGRVRDAFVKPHRVADFIIIMIFVNGLTENVIFSFIPGVPTILFTTAVFWRAHESLSGQP